MVRRRSAIPEARSLESIADSADLRSVMSAAVGCQRNPSRTPSNNAPPPIVAKPTMTPIGTAKSGRFMLG